MVNGCVRDVEALRNIGVGIRALDCHPLRSRKRNQGQVGVPVNFAGVTFHSGQYLYADENGMAVAESELEAEF